MVDTDDILFVGGYAITFPLHKKSFTFLIFTFSLEGWNLIKSKERMDDWYVVCVVANGTLLSMVGDSLLSIRGYDPVHSSLSGLWNYKSLDTLIESIVPNVSSSKILESRSEFYDDGYGFRSKLIEIIGQTPTPKVVMDIESIHSSRYEDMVVICLSPKTSTSFYYRVIRMKVLYHTFPYYVTETARWLLGYPYGNVGYSIESVVYDVHKSFGAFH